MYQEATGGFFEPPNLIMTEFQNKQFQWMKLGEKTCNLGSALATLDLLSREPRLFPIAENGWHGNPDP